MSCASTFHLADLLVHKCGSSQLDIGPDPDRGFSEHMFSAEWTVDEGWGAPHICPLHCLSLHPAAQVLHYAIELFEDMKAYRGVDGHIRLFRPDRHIHQMLRSIRRAALPELDAVEFQNCLRNLVSVDQAWVPPHHLGSLLVRAVIISTDANLQVKVPSKALLYVITCPVETDFSALSLMAEARYIRVTDETWGCTKMGAHYAAAIAVQQEAAVKHGCHDVLWLHGPQRHLTQAGDMNIFMIWTNAEGRRELLTPTATSGIVLPGVARSCVLQLVRDWDHFEVNERMFSIDEVIQALKQGRVQELFACSAEWDVRPITEITYDGLRHLIPSETTESHVSARLHSELSDIQCGKVASAWMVDIE